MTICRFHIPCQDPLIVVFLLPVLTMLDFISGVFHDILLDIQSIDVDANILHYYQVGVSVGALITVMFAFFPGKPLGIPYGKMMGEDKPKDAATVEEQVAEKGDVPNKSGTSPSEWAGDKIPKEERDKLQKKFKLTDEQMVEVMNKSRQQFRGQADVEDATSFHRQLNSVIYVLIICVLVYVVNRDYKNYISFWFARYFPKEARTLGLFVPEPSS